MEVRDFAWQIVTSPELAAKLAAAPERLTDDDPVPIEPVPLEPARPPQLRIVRSSEAKVPGLEGMPDPEQRARILHGFANHELQAVELFAWALLAFPRAPVAFRNGLLKILADEQRHTSMYIARLEAIGVAFGAHPVSGYFWNKVSQMTTPARFVSAMSLTFENANLDHTTDYAEAARAAGDRRTAALLDVVHRDEISHVRFGWTWLARFRESPDQSMWDAWTANLDWPLRAAKARGRHFHRDGRMAAGLDDDFIERLEAESDPAS